MPFACTQTEEALLFFLSCIPQLNQSLFSQGKILDASLNYLKDTEYKKHKEEPRGGFCWWFGVFLTIYPLHSLYSHRQILAGRRQKSAADPAILGQKGKHLLFLYRQLALRVSPADGQMRPGASRGCIPWEHPAAASQGCSHTSRPESQSKASCRARYHDGAGSEGLSG